MNHGMEMMRLKMITDLSIWVQKEHGKLKGNGYT